MAHLTISPGPITTLTLTRPDVRNALDDTLIAELVGWAASIRSDGSVRVVVLQGAGPAFCAGADLRWMARMADYSREENLADARRAAAMLHALDSVPVPVIARVHGAALGGGAGLTALCDVVIAADDATFGFTETTLGIVPAMIAPYVVRRIGLSAARRYCLSGERFGAIEARTIGLVHEITPAAELDDRVRWQAEQFLRAAPTAIAETKRLLSAVAGRHPGDVLALTAEVIARQRVSAEGQEGLRAFLDKREPAWRAAGENRVDGSGPPDDPARPSSGARRP